ncbi:MAG: glycerophosphodiester phosphodiesterase family protein [Gemmatimonadota bacterium]
MFGHDGAVRVIGHRGAGGVAPENTLPALRHATAAGADAVELDLRCARCGTLVLLHDPTVDRTTDQTGPVEGYWLEDLRALDAGYRFSVDGGRTFPFRGKAVRIPTLDEAIDELGDRPAVLEVKSERAGAALAAWLAKGEGGRNILVGGFSSRAVRPAAARARWRCATEEVLAPYVLLGKIGVRRRLPTDVTALMVPERRRGIRVVTRRLVRAAHRDGLGVFVWTVNRPGRMRRLLDLGVDGLITDYPSIARRIIDEREAEEPRRSASTAPS